MNVASKIISIVLPGRSGGFLARLVVPNSLSTYFLIDKDRLTMNWRAKD